ncbi:hypothetical protein [Sphingobium aromaticiconvertens]|uniref:hypothetical protein n=1 Tax=Sphingobium aromaticiconvertens TaxID=365341 RepID=UPI003015FF5D
MVWLWAAMASLALPVAASALPNHSMLSHDLAVGEPTRKALLDVLRPVIARDLGQPVRFVVTVLRTQDGWAFAHVVPQTATGGAIDFSKTRHAERLQAGILDGPDIYALMENRGGRWIVRDFVVGPTDVTYAGWPDDYGAPAALFGLP